MIQVTAQTPSIIELLPQRAGKDLRGTEVQPFSVRVVPSKTREKEAEDEARENEKIQIDRQNLEVNRLTSSSTYWTAWFTLGMAAIAFGQAILFGIQLRLMNQTLKQTEEASKAAKINAEVAQSTSRPHVFLTSARFTPIRMVMDSAGRPVQENPTVTVGHTNVGAVPAVLRNVDCKIRVVDADKLYNPYAMNWFQLNEGSFTAFPPNAEKEWSFEFDGKYDSTIESEIAVGKKWLVAYVAARYEDVIGTEYRRYSCLRYRPDLQKQFFAVGGRKYNYEEKWADEKNLISSNQAPASPQEIEDAKLQRFFGQIFRSGKRRTAS